MFSPPLKKSIVFLKYALKMDLVKGAWFDLYHVSVGDYVIKGTKGELYPCKPDIFQEIYSRYVPLSPLHEEPVTLGGKNEERAKM